MTDNFGKLDKSVKDLNESIKEHCKDLVTSKMDLVNCAVADFRKELVSTTTTMKQKDEKHSSAIETMRKEFNDLKEDILNKNYQFE